jgi:hypothetical protein
MRILVRRKILFRGKAASLVAPCFGHGLGLFVALLVPPAPFGGSEWIPMKGTRCQRVRLPCLVDGDAFADARALPRARSLPCP